MSMDAASEARVLRIAVRSGWNHRHNSEYQFKYVRAMIRRLKDLRS